MKTTATRAASTVKQLGTEEQYGVRKQIANLHKAGKKAKEITADLSVSLGVKVSLRHVENVITQYKAGGMKALTPKQEGRKVGEKRLLTPAQEAEIVKLITDKCPEQVKMKGFLWNRENVHDLILRKYGIDMALSTMGYYLARWGFTKQRPITISKKQNPAEVQRWVDEEYPAIHERAKEEGAEIFWGDETSIQNTANYVKGYAPKGKTPVARTESERIRVNMVSAITNQGKLRFLFYHDTMNQQKLMDFMERLIKDTPRKVYLILDNLKVHHGKLVTAWLEERKTQIEVFYLPAYSPELNPDEYLNNTLKQDMGNRQQADSVDDMENRAAFCMKQLQDKPRTVRNLFKHPKVVYTDLL